MTVRSRREGEREGLSWGSLALADRQTHWQGCSSSSLVVGKRESESICSDTVIFQDRSSCKEYFYSPRNQNEEACRRHKCLY